MYRLKKIGHSIVRARPYRRKLQERRIFFDKAKDDGDKAKDESKEAGYDGQFSHRF
jgi:hypothetical protein